MSENVQVLYKVENRCFKLSQSSLRKIVFSPRVYQFLGTGQHQLEALFHSFFSSFSLCDRQILNAVKDDFKQSTQLLVKIHNKCVFVHSPLLFPFYGTFYAL